MDDTYLVEIRLARTRWKIKELTRMIAEKADIEPYRERHPHITLFGPFSISDNNDEARILDVIAAAARPYAAIPFMITGWEKKEGMHGGVVAFSVRPSPELVSLTYRIVQALLPFTESLNAWDTQPEKKWFHATIANRLPPGKADETLAMLETALSDPVPVKVPEKTIRERLSAFMDRTLLLHRHHPLALRPVLLDDAGLRITVMHNEDILGEYDLLNQRWLTRPEIESPAAWQQTLRMYRQQAGFELTSPIPHTPGDIFLIGDLHLGHANIIRYCARPFAETDPAEMDRVLLSNWNFTVSPDDRVCFLGDFTYRNNRPDREYRRQLSGKITWVGGNHDTKLEGTVPSLSLEFYGRKFLLVHDPADAPPDFDGWVIHGHYHNNELATCPFVDFSRRRINVSAEVVGYIPVGLKEICAVLDRHSRTDPAQILLRYPYTG